MENGNILVGQALFEPTTGWSAVVGHGIFCGIRAGKWALFAKIRLLGRFCLSQAPKSVVVDFFDPWFGGKIAGSLHRRLWKTRGDSNHSGSCAQTLVLILHMCTSPQKGCFFWKNPPRSADRWAFWQHPTRIFILPCVKLRFSTGLSTMFSTACGKVGEKSTDLPTAVGNSCGKRGGFQQRRRGVIFTIISQRGQFPLISLIISSISVRNTGF